MGFFIHQASAASHMVSNVVESCKRVTENGKAVDLPVREVMA